MPAPPQAADAHALLPKETDLPPAPEKAQESPAKPLEVVALRAGFYGGMRRAEGDVFTVGNAKALGSWMRLCDAAAEKRRQDLLKQNAGK